MVRWLNQPEALLLFDQLQVLAAESLVNAAHALRESLHSESELQIAQDHARKAEFYSNCSSLIQDMQTKVEDGAEDFNFHTVEIKPITLTEIPHE